MLLSAVIFLKPLDVLNFTQVPFGRAVHSWFMDLVNQFDPQLGQNLHENVHEKPFTVSDLRGNPNHAPARPEEPPISYWIRFTTLEANLSQFVLERILPNLPEKLSLGQAIFQVTGYTDDAAVHPWAGKSSYADLVQTYLLAARKPFASFELLFGSPTAFHVRGKYQPFPLPELLITSWLNRWNAFAPVVFPEEARPFAEGSLAVSRYSLHTQAPNYGKEIRIGFVGKCSFRILENDPYWLRLVHTLAQYAFYCGSGHKTTQGMGQTKYIQSK